MDSNKKFTKEKKELLIFLYHQTGKVSINDIVVSFGLSNEDIGKLLYILINSNLIEGGDEWKTLGNKDKDIAHINLMYKLSPEGRTLVRDQYFPPISVPMINNDKRKITLVSNSPNAVVQEGNNNKNTKKIKKTTNPKPSKNPLLKIIVWLSSLFN